jgi:hypothetical protein
MNDDLATFELIATAMFCEYLRGEDDTNFPEALLEWDDADQDYWRGQAAVFLATVAFT